MVKTPYFQWRTMRGACPCEGLVRARGVSTGQEGEGERRSREVKNGVCGNSQRAREGFLNSGRKGLEESGGKQRGYLPEGQEDETAMEEVGINAEVRGRGWSCG